MRYDNRLIALDTETGGLINKKQAATIDVALTEVAMVSVCAEKLIILEQDSWLIKPYDDGLIYTARAEQVSGISKQLCINEGIDVELVYKHCLKFLKSNKMGSKKPILWMQNKVFDIPFMVNLFLLFGDDFWKHIERVEDTLHWARLKWVESSDYKLGTIASNLELDLVEAHRAMPDTIATAKIVIKFIKSLRGAGSQQTNESQSVKRIRDDYKF